MRIERIRKLIWGADIFVFSGTALCFWLFFLSGSSDLIYDHPEEWPARGKTDPGSVKLRDPETWRDYEIAMLKFPMNGPKPPPPVVEGPDGTSGPSESELEKLATLVSYRRFIPSTDEASITLAMKAGGPPVVLRVGEQVPTSVWLLVDVLENTAIFKHSDKPEAELQELKMVAPEITMDGGGIGPATPDGVPPTPGAGAPTAIVVRNEPEPIEVRPGVFKVTEQDDEWFKDENHVEAVRQSIKVQPWKNPESGRYEGVKVSKVKPNSYLAKRGAKRGDILISINGQPVSSREGVINYLRKSGKGKKQYIVKLIRNGQPMTRTFTR